MHTEQRIDCQPLARDGTPQIDRRRPIESAPVIGGEDEVRSTYDEIEREALGNIYNGSRNLYRVDLSCLSCDRER